MIYLPIELQSSNCVVVQDKDTIRVYDTAPTYNSTVDYTDYYVNSHYLHTSGERTFSNYTTLPLCTSLSDYTTNISYRNDFPMILLTFMLIVGFIWFIIHFLFGRFVTGGKKYV